MRQQNRFNGVLVCCTGSPVYFAGWHFKNIGSDIILVYTPEVHFFGLKQVDVLVIESIHEVPNISKCQPSKYHVDCSSARENFKIELFTVTK